MAHKQPNQAELDAGIQAALATEGKPDDLGTPDPKKETPDPKKETQDPKPKDGEGDGGVKPEPKKAEGDAADGDKGEDGETDEAAELRKKVANSTRENQIIYAQNKKMAEAFDKATEVPEPTEEELQKEYSDWEGMSEFEKKMAKNDLINTRRFAAIKEASKDFKDLDQWQGKVNEFIDNPENLTKYPLLEGKEAEFKLYAIKPTRRGVDFDDLVAGFLFTADATKPKHKGKMFENGSGGDKKSIKPANTKLSVEESNKLRQNNYPEYKRQLRAGNISEEIPA